MTGVDAAIRLQMKTTVEEALNHKFAAVVARALTAIGESMAAPLPERLLQMVHSRGSPIRKASGGFTRLQAAHGPRNDPASTCW